MDSYNSTGHSHSPDGNNFGSLLPVGSANIAHAPTLLARSVVPTGMRLTKILGHLRVYVWSVAGQIGPEAVLEFVQHALRQDFEMQKEQNHG